MILLVGIATAQGTVEIKDVCFEEANSKLLISNKTAVKALLSTVYSTDCRRKKDIEQKLIVETDSQNHTNSAKVKCYMHAHHVSHRMYCTVPIRPIRRARARI